MSAIELREPPLLLAHPRPGEPPLVYAPLSGLLVELNGTAVELVELLAGGTAPDRLTPEQRACVDQLLEVGLVATEDAPVIDPTPPDSGEFRPTTATLFLTGRCNLGCSYCYADGGSSDTTMTWEIASATIAAVIGNAVATGAPEIGVIFHGSGEPTLAMPLMVRCVEHARAEAAAHGVGAHFSLGTNGVMSPRHVEWIAANIDSVTISIDGTPEMHDAQRPTAGGRKPSSHVVLETLRRFDELGVEYGLRVTVTAVTAPRMPEIVEFLARETRCAVFQLEPVSLSGRAESGGHAAVDPQVFVSGFLAAHRVAAARGRRLQLAGTDPSNVVHQYCGMGQASFVATEAGRVLGCYETARDADPRRDHFTIGELVDGAFRFDDAAALDLRAESLAVKEPCRVCWARYSCGGDCHAKMAQLGDPGEVVDRRRCYAIREVARARILERYGFGWPEAPSTSLAEYLATTRGPKESHEPPARRRLPVW